MIKENVFEKIKDVFDFVVKSKQSNFYRNFYDAASLDSPKNFDSLPLLQKNDLLQIPIGERSYLPNSQVRGYSLTSGTIDYRHILMLPFSKPSPVFEIKVFPKSKMKDLRVTGIIYLTSPLHGMARHMVYADQNAVPFIMSKVEDFKLSVSMIREGGLNGIISTPTIISRYLPYLTKEGLNKSIKWLCLAGEHCSSQRLKELQTNLPNASIEFVYGSAESGIIGYQCPHLLGSTNRYHLAPEIYLEVVDKEGKPTREEGDIVISTLVKNAFPLLRYRNGDRGVLKDGTCPCGQEKTLTLLGRSGMDLAKISGVTLHAEALERALDKVKFELEPYYYAKVTEQQSGSRLKPQIQLELVSKVSPVSEDLKSEARKDISRNLWLSSKNTLQDLVDQGVFLPLQLKFVLKPRETNLKKTKLIEYIPS